MASHQIDAPQGCNSAENKNLSQMERLVKNKEVEDRLRYLIRTRNDISRIVKIKY